MTDQRRLVDDIDTWAPAGWTPSDVGWHDDEPFGSVLGDPLMGSPLFDVSAFDAAPEQGEGANVGSDGGGSDGGGFGAGVSVTVAVASLSGFSSCPALSL